MTDIDYEALAKASYDSTKQPPEPDWEDQGRPTKTAYRVEARAVVAALGDQGLVVVRKEDVDVALRWGQDLGAMFGNTVPNCFVETYDRLAALVAAPGSEGDQP